MRRFYVGLAATLHDPALAVVGPDGRPLFAEAAERHLQHKRAYGCPPDDLVRAAELIGRFCAPDDEIVVATSWSGSFLARVTAASIARGDVAGPAGDDPRGAQLSWPSPGSELFVFGMRNAVSQAGLSLAYGRRLANRVTVRRYDHHLCHAALAAYTSPFTECAVAVVDGFGEGRSASFYRFADGRLSCLSDHLDGADEVRQNVSLGHLYARVCALCGFDPLLGEEWKVMGLAAYGSRDPELVDLLRPLVRTEGLALRSGCSDAELARRLKALRERARRPGSPPHSVADLARSGQEVFEELMTELLDALHRRLPADDLAFAGGCALNSSYNGRIPGRTRFRRLHVPSAPGDDGCALGAAVLAYLEDHPGAPRPSGLDDPYLGSELRPEGLAELTAFAGPERVTTGFDAVVDRAAALLAEGGIVAWVQGRAEFGPRALGNRSILADPRRPGMKERLNSAVKFREGFRPFAPAILDRHGAEFFLDYQTCRYMERTLDWRPEVVGRVPAVVHHDGTGRVQSVRREWNPRFHRLLEAFHERTGIPVLLNTSLNVMGKPIVHSVEDAVGVFATTGLDALALGDVLLEK